MYTTLIPRMTTLIAFVFTLCLSPHSALAAYQDPPDLVYAGRDANYAPVMKQYLADIRSLDAAIMASNNVDYLVVAVGLARVFMSDTRTSISIFIDADANPSTGCILPGFERGAEYRLDATLMPSSVLDPTRSVQASLWQLPKDLSETAQFTDENAKAGRGNYPARLVWAPSLRSTADNLVDVVEVAIPTSLLGNTSNANISVLSYLPQLGAINPLQTGLSNKQGDRAPDFGQFNTTTRSVVNDQPISPILSLEDPQGDNLVPGGGEAGPDLRQVHIQTVGDQFRMMLVFNQDLIQSMWDPNLGFKITFDSDRSLATGQFFMGDKVPSWGGDVAINWVAGPEGVSDFSVTHELKVTAAATPLGGPNGNGGFAANDGQWYISGNLLYLQFNKSMLDVFKLTDMAPGFPIGDVIFQRLAAGDGVRVSVQMLVQNNPLANDFTDWAPARNWVFDTATGQGIPPLALDPAKSRVLTDQDVGADLLDITSLQYQVDADNLIFKATVANWIRDDKQLLLQLHLDADSDPTTGLEIVDGTGAALIGAEYTIEVKAYDDYMRTGYDLQLASAISSPGGVTAKSYYHDAWLKVVPPSSLAPNGTPGTITFTIPRSEIPLVQDRVNLLMLTGQWSRVPGQPPTVAYYDHLPNSGVARLTLSSDLSPIDGSCGSADGESLPSRPASGLCSAGTASQLSGTGPWSWSCAGSNGGSTAHCAAYLSDKVSPSVTSFAMPSTAVSPTVPITSLTAADNVAVTGYLVTDSGTPPAPTAPGWSLTPPATFTFTGYGAHTAYAWARDAAGNVSPPATTTVTINSTASAPAPPTEVWAVAGDGKAIISFTTPANDGGSPITRYTVLSTPGSISGTGSESPVTVSGLANGTAYVFTVSATNAIGSGPTSAASNSVTPTAGTTENLVADPGFEAGDAAWHSASSGGYSVIYNEDGTGNNGSNWMVWLGGGDNLNESIYQDVAIPPHATSAFLDFYIDIDTEDTSSTANDTFKVELVDPATGGTVKVLGAASNLDATSGWTRSRDFDLLPYRGQTVRLKFSEMTNASLLTSFYVDDVSIRVVASTDAIPPQITSFSMPPSALSATVAITSLTATDNVGIAGYCVAETNSSASCNWSGTAPGYHTFGELPLGTATLKRLYAFARDPAGNVSAPSSTETSITIVTTPGAPTTVSATAGNGSATVTFAAPASTGGSEIREYTVSSIPGNITASGSGSPITVTGLNNGVSYSFVVRATNSAGTGSASSASNAVMPVGPINGACGSANGASFSILPASNLCSAGTASPVTGIGPWNWSCSGANGGSTAGCSASYREPTDCGTPHWQPPRASQLAAHLAGELVINGRSANICDEVGIFDGAGNLVGASHARADGKYGDLAVFGDSPLTAEDEGAGEGEGLTVRVWDAASQREYGSVSLLPLEQFMNYLPYRPPLSFASESWTYLKIVVDPGERVDLKGGWNSVGWGTNQGYYTGAAPDPGEYASDAVMTGTGTLSGAFQSLGLASTDSFVVVGPAAEVYVPGSPFNTLKSLLPGKAYWIYLSGDKSVTLPGVPLQPAQQLTLAPGWSQVAYWGNEGSAPGAGFGCLGTVFNVVVNEGGGVFIPGSPFNTLNALQKNKGYFIHTTAPASLKYQCQ